MKKLVVMLAAIDGLKKGATVEVDPKKAARYIARGHAVAVDEKVARAAGEEHGNGGDDDADDEPAIPDLGKAIAKALEPVISEVRTMREEIDELATPPRTRGTRHTEDLDDAELEGEQRATDDDDDEGEHVARRGAGEQLAAEIVRALSDARERREGRAAVVRAYDFRGREVDEGTGLKMARLIRADAAAKKFSVTTGDVLRQWGYKGMAKRVEEVRNFASPEKRGLSQSVFADGGALVPEEFSADLIPLLRARNVIRQAGARTIEMGASLTLPKQTSSSTASYIGEGTVITPSKPGLGQIKFAEKKLAVGVVISNDLIKNASLSADAWVRDDMVLTAATKEEVSALFGTGTVYAPAGIETLIASANRFDMTAVDRTAPTLAEIRKWIAKCVRIVKQSKVPMISPAWVFNARFEEFLMGLSDGNGNPVFEAALTAGRLRGFPVYTTENVPDNLANFAAANSDETRAFFGDFAQFVIAESRGGMELTVFPDGTYEEGGVAKSGASRDETFVRLLMKHDFNMRYDTAIVDSSARPA